LSIDDYAEGRHVPISKSLEIIAQKFLGNEIIFSKGGDRNEQNIPESEKEVCKKYNIKVVSGVGGSKVQSSSWLLKKVNNV